jgi:hypothetical protein
LTPLIRPGRSIFKEEEEEEGEEEEEEEGEEEEEEEEEEESEIGSFLKDVKDGKKSGREIGYDDLDEEG